MKNGFYAVDLLDELAILEIAKEDGSTSFEIEFESDDCKLKEFFMLYAIDYDFWEEMTKTKNVLYLGKA